MRKILPILLLTTLPSLALATCTWTQNTPTDFSVVCTTANESAPTTAAEGWDVSSCNKGFSVFIAADSGQTLSGSGSITVYVYDAKLSLWGQVKDLAISPTVSAARPEAFPGIWQVVGGNRLAIVPVSVGVSAGGFTGHVTCN
jgi:hypothetical protein